MTTDSQARRIYVVEDEAKLASLLEDYLRREGFEVRTFERGDTALAAIREQPPDLVVLDLMLPGLDGLGVCREVRRFSDLPIIMVTARVEEIENRQALLGFASDPQGTYRFLQQRPQGPRHAGAYAGLHDPHSGLIATEVQEY